MAEDLLLTPLNFNNGVVGRSIMDKKAGVQVSFGYISGLPQEYDDLLHNPQDIALSLESRGMPQDILDGNCRQLIEQCRIQQWNILITKSDLPFDSRWYWIGDLKTLFTMAKQDKVHLPISDFLYDQIMRLLN